MIVLVVKGKGMCLLGSRKNVSSFSMAEQGQGHSVLMTTLTASPNTEISVPFSPQHFSNIHEDRLGLAVLCRVFQKMETLLAQSEKCHLHSGKCYYIAYA